MKNAPLFMIRADSDDGDNHDLFVRAKDRKEAEAMWRDYYELEPDESFMWIQPIPETPAHGPIAWDDILPKDSP